MVCLVQLNATLAVVVFGGLLLLANQPGTSGSPRKTVQRNFPNTVKVLDESIKPCQYVMCAKPIERIKQKQYLDLRLWRVHRHSPQRKNLLRKFVF